MHVIHPDLTLRPASGPDACFLAHRGRVYRWAAAHGLDHHQRLDVIQETFARLLASHPHFPHEASQVAWLRRVASNLAVDHHRRRRTGSLSPDAAALAEVVRDPGLREDAQRLGASLARLTEMQRLVLLAKCVDGETFATIATHLGITIPTAKTHYVRALESLRAAIAQPTPFGSPAP
jgi:RNA polymerase sigma-70 factor (ECF subfamily)